MFALIFKRLTQGWLQHGWSCIHRHQREVGWSGDKIEFHLVFSIKRIIIALYLFIIITYKKSNLYESILKSLHIFPQY